MDQSILRSTKKVLGLAPTDTSFDLDILTHINSAFSVLQDMGVGPEDGFAVEDDSTNWSAFVSANHKSYHLIKSCVYLRVRMLFDPPTSGYHLTAAQKNLEEHEWRLSVQREAVDWVDPAPVLTPAVYDPWEES